MSRTPLLLLSIFAVACVSRTTPPAASAAVTPPVPAAERAGFVLIRENDTIAVERFSYATDHMDGELRLRTPQGEARFVYDVRLDAAVTPTSMNVSVYPPGDTATTPAQRANVTFGADSTRLAVMRRGVDSAQRLATTNASGAVPYINPSPAFMELIVRRALAIGGTSRSVPVYAIGAPQPLMVAVTAIDSSNVRLGFPGVEILLTHDRAGRVTGGSVPAQLLTIVRTSGAP